MMTPKEKTLKVTRIFEMVELYKRATQFSLRDYRNNPQAVEQTFRDAREVFEYDWNALGLPKLKWPKE